MFANPGWFKDVTESRIPSAKNLSGHLFYLGCLGFVLIPVALLIFRGHVFPESLIWLAFSGSAVSLELRGLKKELRQTAYRNGLYHIADETEKNGTLQIEETS